jgi:L-ascorbate metabolism protein UlaG (beta-lactamase superfamily)
MIVALRVLVIASSVAAASSAATQPSAGRAPLQARFIGQMAFAITDGAVTVMTDFPYQVGYVDAPAYSPDELTARRPSTLALITHRHLDHWEPALFAKTGWKVAGPRDVTAGLPADRVLALAGPATFGPVLIEPVDTPHAGIGHYFTS